MKKTLSFAVLAMLMAGQAHAVRGSDPNAANPNQANQAMSNANQDARLAALAKIRSELTAKIESNSMTSQLSSQQKTNLVFNMMKDGEVKKVVDKILADKDAKNSELNQVNLEGLANLQLRNAEANLDTDGGKARESQYILFVKTLGGETRTWKDASQRNNAIAFGKEVNKQVGMSKAPSEAMTTAIKKFEEATGIKLTLEDLKRLCGKA